MNHLKIQPYVKVNFIHNSNMSYKIFLDNVNFYCLLSMFAYWKTKSFLGTELYNSVCQSVCPNESVSIENWYHSKAKLI